MDRKYVEVFDLFRGDSYWVDAVTGEPVPFVPGENEYLIESQAKEFEDFDPKAKDHYGF